MGGRLILAVGASLLAAAPAVAASGSALTGPIEQVPTSWGGAVMSAPIYAAPAPAPPLPAPPPPPAQTRAATPAPALTALDRMLAALDAEAGALDRAALQRQGAPSAPAAPGAPPSADQVGALVVQARSIRPSEQTVEKCVTGPAWWRVSNATTTLWIMATPDRMPMSTPFDDACLRKRLAAARVLILPAAPPAGAQDPFSRGDTPLRPATAPLDQRISPGLWAKLSRRIDNNPVRAADDRDWARLAIVQDLPPGVMTGMIGSATDNSRASHLDAIKPRGMGGAIPLVTSNRSALRPGETPIPRSMGDALGVNGCGGDGWTYPATGPRACLRTPGGADWVEYTLYRYHPRTTLQVIRDTPNLFAPPILVAQRLSRAFDLPGRMGNPAADRAAKLAGEANMLVGRTANSAAQFSDMTYVSDPAPADQEACLKGVLDELDAGHAGLGVQGQVEAWARGDVDSGLKRMNPISACSFGDLSVRFWSAIVAQDMQLIDRAMAAGGTAVAVVEYDPLFMRGGVMERLKAAGYRVETPEDLR